MANTPGRRRLILCGICFRADCPWSKWVDDDGTMEAVDELHQLWIDCQHSEIEAAEAAKLTVEEKRERIAQAIESAQEDIGQTVEIDNLDALLGASIAERETPIETTIERDLSVDDILRKYSEELPNERKEENGNAKQH